MTVLLLAVALAVTAVACVATGARLVSARDDLALAREQAAVLHAVLVTMEPGARTDEVVTLLNATSPFTLSVERVSR